MLLEKAKGASSWIWLKEGLGFVIMTFVRGARLVFGKYLAKSSIRSSQKIPSEILAKNGLKVFIRDSASFLLKHFLELQSLA